MQITKNTLMNKKFIMPLLYRVLLVLSIVLFRASIRSYRRIEPSRILDSA